MAVKKLQESSRRRKFDEIESDSAVEGHQPPLIEAKQEAKRPKTNKKRPWKAVYSERFTVERNWRKGLYKIKRFEGH
ncbi:hypothetical protein WICPIJ_005499, partial [Wickerhamomyces pijperi]